MDELLDQLAVDEVQDGRARLDQGDGHVEGAEDGGVFDPDHPGAHHSQAARQSREFEDLVAVEDADAVEGHVRRPIGLGPHGDDDLLGAEHQPLAVRRRHLDLVRIEEARHAMADLHAVAGELMLQHVHFVVQRLVQARPQVLRSQVLLHPVGPAIEAALAPAGEIQHRLAQGLGGNGPGVHRHAAHAAALVDDQHRPAELGGLDGGAPPRGTASDNNQIIGAHAMHDRLWTSHAQDEPDPLRTHDVQRK